MIIQKIYKLNDSSQILFCSKEYIKDFLSDKSNLDIFTEMKNAKIDDFQEGWEVTFNDGDYMNDFKTFEEAMEYCENQKSILAVSEHNIIIKKEKE
jgi:hypothetical protein